MLHRFTSLVVAVLAIGFAAVQPAAAGPLRDCCSKKNAFCIIPSRGGAAGCAAIGGMFFAANACLNGTLECAVAQQRRATAVITIQPPAVPPRNINLNGTVDVIETEMIQLELTGVDSVFGPVRLQPQAGRASLGMFSPTVDSFFDVFVELALTGPENAMVAQAPIRITAAPVGATFPVEGVPYNSSGGSPTVDRSGAGNGAIVDLSITVLPYPDADGDGVQDAEDACPGTPPATRVNDVGCSDAQLCPPDPDDDGDGKPNSMDACAGTAPAAAIDDSGCSREQFCTAQDATTTMGKGVCRKLDWQNDEPKQPPRDSDCIVDRGGTGALDDSCVPRP